DNNTLAMAKEVIDKAFSTGAGITITIDFLLQMQKRMDNSEELTPIPSKITVQII
ncbi:unnamed protein product, partial [marine sediment metagenome]